MGQNLEKAFKKGALAFLENKKKCECPYRKGSASHDAFRKGYDEQRKEKHKAKEETSA
jgi:ribosome modulation factor